MPQAPSIATCALLAAMSCRQSALSKGIEALISRMIAAGPSAKRPPHIWLEPAMPSLPLLSFTLPIVLLVAGCDRQSGGNSQPKETAASAAPTAEDEAALTGTLDRSHAG